MIRLASRAWSGGGRRLRRQPPPVGLEGGDGGVEAGPVADQADLRSTSASRTAAIVGHGAGGGPRATGARRHQPRAEAGRPRAGRGLDHRLPGPAPNTSPSSSELLASRLAPWTPVQATSPAANSPGTEVRPVEVGLDAAHHVVRGRADRNRIARQVEPGGAAGLGDRAGSARAPSSRRGAASDRNTGRPVRASSRTMRARHAVARREVAGRLVARHERLAVGVDQPGAFAAQRLRQQEARLRPRPGSAVGWNCTNSRSATRAPAAQRHRDAVAGRHLGVGRLAEHLAGAAGREQRRARPARSAASRRDRGTRRRRRGRPRPGSRSRARARRPGCAPCAAVRGPQASRRSRGRSRRARAARGGRCAPPRGPSATLAVRRRDRTRAPQSISSRTSARALVDEDAHRVGRRTARRRRPACPSRAARDRRRRRPRRRCRPGRSRCCSRPRPPWSGAARCAGLARAPARPAARRSRCRR